MPAIIQDLWDRSLQPALQRMGVDVRRYPPEAAPDWRVRAMDELLSRGAVGSALESDLDFLHFCAVHAAESHSQTYQDLFVRRHLRDKQRGDKRDGYFVEFGATDGVNLSNSKAFESQFGWRGIVAEPARCWHERIRRNRHCAIDFRCVWTKSGERLQFREATNPDYSTLESLKAKDHHAAHRNEGAVYEVETVSLNDLLATHGAPAEIDYLSLDTEGSELAILQHFDFSKHRFAAITVEHNYTADRRPLQELLKSHGYVHVLEAFSRQDDWFVAG